MFFLCKIGVGPCRIDAFKHTHRMRYFVYDHEVDMLCLVSKEGHKVEGGERRPLPSKAHRLFALMDTAEQRGYRVVV